MQATPPTVIVIFGATGDLAKRKLFSALFSLFQRGALPEKFKIVGFARSDLETPDFKEFISKSVKSKDRSFLNMALYQKGVFEDSAAYRGLGDILLKADREFDTCSNKLFYLAVAPKYFKTIFENLAASGLTIPCSDGEGWTRVLVEKPFGEDIKTAQELDAMLAKLFREEQIFRIDHYLARETMQNILTFRFSNAIFESLWNNKYIDNVEIKLLETGEVGQRGDFYDDIGALRDVGQNHLLQMLALIAMENPKKFEAESIRRERAKVLESLRPIQESEIKDATTRGQYEGFTDIDGVEKDSKTETYFKVKAHINSARWRGVPFYLESGKCMKEDVVEINIYFKAALSCFCPDTHKKHQHQNMLSFKVKPEEKISIRFWVKKPGLKNDVEPKNLAFQYEGKDLPETMTEAYEKVLFDVILGEQMLFTSTREVEAAWRFITPILKVWEENKMPLKIYKKGEYPRT